MQAEPILAWISETAFSDVTFFDTLLYSQKEKGWCFVLDLDREIIKCSVIELFCFETTGSYLLKLPSFMHSAET